MFGLATMGTKDGAQGVNVTGPSKYGDELRNKVLNEVLKGERTIVVIAEENELLTNTVRDWLKKHYEANPDDPRRHLIERQSERYQRGEKPEEKDMATAAIAEDTLSGSDERAHKTAPHPNKAEILKAVDGGMSVVDAAQHYRVSKATIYTWRSSAKPPISPSDERETAAWKHFDEGKTTKEVRDELKLHGKTAKRFRLNWQNLQTTLKKRAALQKARAQRLANVRGEQQELPITRSEPTLMSSPGSVVQLRRPQIPPSTAIVPVSQQQGAAMVEMFQECVEERQTLRGMVGILQRENEGMKKKLDAYRRAYGEIQA